MIRGSISIRDVKLYSGEPTLYIVDPDGPVIRELDQRMSRSQAAAKRFVRKRTGRLYSSIRKNRGFTSRSAYVDVLAGGSARKFRYTLVEHDGSPPHIIRPRRKKALRFVAGGRVVFAQRVRHPGTRGTKFLERALPFAGGY
jgi:hypothetical protein